MTIFHVNKLKFDLCFSNLINMKKKILVVDDEETLRWALHEALTDEGYDVENIDDGVKALEYVKKTDYDLVISDLRMPTMGGIQLISETKKIRPNIKSVIITAYGSIESVIEAMHVGVSDFVTKPFKIEHIKTVIHKILNNSLTTHNDIGDVKRNEDVKFEDDDEWKQTKTCYLARNSRMSANHVFHDYITIGRLSAFLFGSVSNKVSLEKLDSIIKTIFRYRYMTETDKSPASLLRNINQYFCKNIVQRFPVTLFCAVLDTQSQLLCFSGYGEELTSLVCMPNKETVVLESHPFSLNMFPGTTILEETVSFVSGSKLIVILNSLLAAATKKGTIASYIEKLKDVMTDENFNNCEYVAKGVKLQIGKFEELNDNKKDISVVVSDIGYETNTICWEKAIALKVPVDNYEKILEQLETVLLFVVVDNIKRHQIITSVNEAVLNALAFAYNKNKYGEVSIRIFKLRDEIITEVCDHGCGFDIKDYGEVEKTIHADFTEKKGRGISLMKRLMDRVIIQSSKKTGTTVHMAKRVTCNEN